MNPQIVGSPRAESFMQMPLSYIEARLRARRSGFYEGDRLRKLIEARDVEELCKRIYHDLAVFSHLELEHQLRQDTISELSSLLVFLPAGVGRLFRALLRRFQVDNIAVVLHTWADGRDLDAAEPYLFELPPSIDVPVEELIAAPDVEKFVSAVPDEALRTGMRDVMDVYRSSQQTAFLEMGLDCAFWDGVYQALNGLSRSGRQECRGPIDLELKSVRIVYVLRAARTYGLPWETVEPLVPPGGVGSKLADLHGLYENPEGRAVMDLCPELSQWGVDEQTAGDLCELEKAFWSEVSRKAHRLFYSAYDSPASIVSYYYLRRAELRNLTSLTEMVRHGWSRDEMAERLGLDV